MLATKTEVKADNIGNSKELPQNVEAEQAVLGAFLNNNDSVNKVADFLLPEHFFVPLHKKIYEAINRFMEKGLIASPVTLKSYFENDESFSDTKINTLDYFVKLSANATSYVNIVPYAKEIVENSIRRSLIDVSNSTIENSYLRDIKTSASEILEKAEQKLFNLASSGNSESSYIPLGTSLVRALDIISKAKENSKEISGTSTGYIDLDRILGGLQNSDLLILAARPSMGKTSLAVNVALNSAVEFQKEKIGEDEKRKSVAVFSLEMPSEQIASRLLSIRTGIEGSRIRIGSISSDEFASLSNEVAELNDIPLFIDDTPALSISAIRTRARRLKRQHNLGLIVVDYLQLLRGSSANEGNRVQEIGEISQGLKAIAKELQVPVIALSQLSRAVESRDDKRPQLSDLRESGNIEQDADVVMFIFREEYYLARGMPREDDEKFSAWEEQMNKVKNITEVIIAKQRNGPIGTVKLRFDSTTTGFSNLDITHYD